jgi:hypothetical protein
MKKICVDFDKTLCSDDKFGIPNQKVIAYIKREHKFGPQLYINTSRTNLHHQEIIDWLKKYKLFNLFFNIYYKKPEADVYIDDKALNTSDI